jgi:hypothetical protein
MTLSRTSSPTEPINDEIHKQDGGPRVDLARHPGAYDRKFWSKDRLHPPELGHRAVALASSALLEQHSLSFRPEDRELDRDRTTRLGYLRSFALEVAPRVPRRVHDLGRFAYRACEDGRGYESV